MALPFGLARPRCCSHCAAPAFARAGLSLQAEEPVTVPARPGDLPRHLGEAPVGAAVPGKALFKDHDAVQDALMLTDEMRAREKRPQLRPGRHARLTVLPCSFPGPGKSVEQAPRLGIEIAERVRLQAIGNEPDQQGAGKMERGWLAGQHAPAAAQAVLVEIAKRRDLVGHPTGHAPSPSGRLASHAWRMARPTPSCTVPVSTLQILAALAPGSAEPACNVAERDDHGRGQAFSPCVEPGCFSGRKLDDACGQFLKALVPV